MKPYTIIYYETLGLTKVCHWEHIEIDDLEKLFKKYDIAYIFEGHMKLVAYMR